MSCASISGKLTPLSELCTFIVHSFNKSGLSVSVGQAVLMVGGWQARSLPSGTRPPALVHPREGLPLELDNRFLLLRCSACPTPTPWLQSLTKSCSCHPPNITNNSRRHPPYLRPQHPPPRPASNPLPIHQFTSPTLKLQFTRLKAETQVLSLALETFFIWLQFPFQPRLLLLPPGTLPPGCPLCHCQPRKHPITSHSSTPLLQPVSSA